MLRMKERKLSKYYVSFVQIIVLSIVFFFVINNEFIVFIREFISNLPVGQNLIEAVAVKGYIIFRAISSSPSIMALFVFVLQMTLITCNLFVYFAYFQNTFFGYFEKVVVKNNEKETKLNFYTHPYLENVRLLN